MPRTRISIVAAAITVAALTACSSGNATEPAEPTTETSTAPETQAPAETEVAGPERGTKENPYSVGATLEFDGWTATVDRVLADRAEVYAEAASEPAPAADGNIIEIRYTVTRTSSTAGETLELNARVDTEFRPEPDENGDIWRHSTRPDDLVFEAAPGQSVSLSTFQYVEHDIAAQAEVPVSISMTGDNPVELYVLASIE